MGRLRPKPAVTAVRASGVARVHDAELRLAVNGEEPFRAPSRNLRAIACMYNFAPAQFVMTKAFSERYGVTGIAFARYAVGTLVMAGVLAVLRPGWPSAETWRSNGLRAVLVVATALCFFHGLSVLPLAEALALSFLSPIFIALFAALLLRERVRPPVWAGLVVGFVGVGIVVAGQVEAEGPLAGAGSASDPASVSASTWGIAAILAAASDHLSDLNLNPLNVLGVGFCCANQIVRPLSCINLNKIVQAAILLKNGELI